MPSKTVWKADVTTSIQQMSSWPSLSIEWDDRHNRRIARQIFYAKFRYKAAVEDVNYEASRNIDRNLMNRLADCTFVQRNENLLITGSTGIGNVNHMIM
ncbi:ATP-binding protein [Sphingobacterium multivorum]|uniref:ATP-binding protein n=1 Tax=Sphingobacterium multivorum TaxID=28454 RepID=UPI0028A8A850|nr:ATP-binding protein [Sphingobacterium multivorum]